MLFLILKGVRCSIGNVSGIERYPHMKIIIPNKVINPKILRQPIWLNKNPPIIGAKMGAIIIICINNENIFDDSFSEQLSSTIALGVTKPAEAPIACISRAINNHSRFCVIVAMKEPKLKIQIPTNNGIRLPYLSNKGPYIPCPIANPTRNTDKVN